MEPLATLADLTRLSREVWTEDTTEAALSLLDAASSVVRGYCGWSITAAADQTIVLDGPGGHTLALPLLGTVTVTNVQIVIGDVVTAVTDYTVSASRGLLHRDRGWPTGYATVQITCSGGLDTVPAEIVAVVCSMVDRYVSQPTGVLRDTAGHVTRIYTPDAGSLALTRAERNVLGPYRLSRDV